MVKTCGSPIIGRVTTAALIAKLTRVCVVLGVTGGAVHGRALEDTALMATLASHIGMFAFEMECKLRVVYCSVPFIGRVAGGAVCAKYAVVFVIF